MLAADHRLRDSEAFRRTVRAGRRAGGPALVVHVHTDPGPATGSGSTARAPRVGFVVSKAVGNAVVRNRVKRRLRHLSRGLLGELPTGSEVVVRALPAAADLSSAELGGELARCLGRAGRGAPRTGNRTGGRA